MAALPAPRLILASRSPRRALLLREAGYAFEQCLPGYDDPSQPMADAGLSPQDWAKTLARRKAHTMFDRVGPRVVLTADTLCVGSDGRLIGTPQTPDEAEAMLSLFVNDDHDVVTAIALWKDEPEPVAYVDTARVTFGPLSGDQLHAYLDTGEWRGKAGGYNLFERQAAGWPICVRGDPTTVVGLPMVLLAGELAKRGIHPTP